ncbi:hypothetical protein [uncultured Methanolobus sp.]|uniref:hypothetical protein n=1 Tax=uncultured Methanolobus sp. TaxID=218300 RepID=UPI0029C79DDF|nr:hypothetical protein [uncultured Methanolobus sp.]
MGQLICDLKDKDFMAIIGSKNGDKSTLMKVIRGLIKTFSSTVKLLGEVPRT